MAHDPGEPLSTNTDIFEKAIGTARLWLGQWSGPFRALRLPTGLLDLKLLTSAPANPASGWARLNVLNNVVKMINSSGTDLLASTIAAAGGQDLTHHAYPWATLKRGDGLAPSTFGLDTEYKWGQWSEAKLDLNDAAGGTIPEPPVGEELDGRSDPTSRRTAFALFNDINTEEGNTVILDMRMAIPEAFTTWGTNGIILHHKIDADGAAGNGTDTGTVAISVYDPSTGSDTVAETTTRTRTNAQAADTVYQDVQITGATLNGMTNPFAAGDMIHLRIQCAGAFVQGLSSPSFWLGRLSAYFE